MVTRGGDWIQTFTGRQYWPLDPRADEVDIADIAHALSLLCRFTGHCERFYSVAEHSVHVSFVVDAPGIARQLVLHALLHDAAEAYCNDIARPVKRSITGYDEIEGLNAAVIFERFGLPGLRPHDQKLLKQADNAMLVAEMEVLMKPPPVAWTPVDVPDDMLREARYRVSWGKQWGPLAWEANFLHRFTELTS